MRDPGTEFDLVTVGETMAMVTTYDGSALDADTAMILRAGGAESNVAIIVAQLGLRTAWVSSIGADPLGDVVLTAIAARGVDVASVQRDPTRPTGVYFKNPAPAGTTVHYYRAGSAASAMGTRLASRVEGRARLLHLSGITPALSPTCSELIDRLIDRKRPTSTVSFDVNHRPALWTFPAAGRLLALAQQADIVFVGRDEAADLWETSDAYAIRRLIDRPRHLIVKDGAVEAVGFDGDAVTRQPARLVNVVDAVGAGDAFAAGWLAGHLQARPPAQKLALGHWVAAQVIQSPSDGADIPDIAAIIDQIDF